MTTRIFDPNQTIFGIPEKQLFPQINIYGVGYLDRF